MAAYYRHGQNDDCDEWQEEISGQVNLMAFAGVGRVVRDLRSAFGIEAAEKGVPVRFIQSTLGHSSVAVTAGYDAKFAPDVAAKALREMVESGRKSSVLAQPLAQAG